MSDGRVFTQYTPACETWPTSVTSNQARRAMIVNGAAIIDINRKMIETSRALGEVRAPVCFGTNVSGTALPEVQNLVCDERQCTMVPSAAPGGLGMRPIGLKRMPGP